MAKDEQQKEHTFFTKLQTVFGTFIGGPLAGTYMFYKNFLAVGKKTYAKRSLRIGIGFTISMFLYTILAPEEIVSRIPNTTLPVIYTALAAFFFYKYLEDQITEQLAHKGKKQGNWTVVGIIIAGLVITIIILVGLMSIIPGSRE